MSPSTASFESAQLITCATLAYRNSIGPLQCVQAPAELERRQKAAKASKHSNLEQDRLDWAAPITGAQL